ncbi:MAG: hypothetical protein ACI837_002588 [Crocinitomicaceae bacterium]|jgi:hypothetical protein
MKGIAQDSDSPFVNYDQFEALVKEVREHRKERLLSMDDFNTMSKKENVFILDTRSKAMYDAKHIKGAIHLNFSDFTQANLDALFGSRDVTILIYCNNNIDESELSIPFTVPSAIPFIVPTTISTVDIMQIPQEYFVTKVSIPDYNFEVLVPNFSTAIGSTTNSENEWGKLQIQEGPRPESSPIDVIDTTPPITLALNIPTYINLFGYGYKNVYELKELVSVLDPRISFEGTSVLIGQ